MTLSRTDLAVETAEELSSSRDIFSPGTGVTRTESLHCGCPVTRIRVATHAGASLPRRPPAADVDPDANLGLALGLTEEEVNSIVPVSKMKQLAKQRTGANDQNSFYKLNPDVSDLPDKLAKNINGVKLLVMGTVDTGGSGCVCPEHVMLKAILTNLVFRRDDVVIMDMEAGLEHLGRGTASMMDQFIVVIEPGARSVQTYVRIKELAKDIGVTKVRVVANKIRDESDREFIRSRIPADDLLGFIS